MLDETSAGLHTSQNIPFITDGNMRVMVQITKFCLASCQLCMRAIPIMIIMQRSIVYHCWNIWVLMLKQFTGETSLIYKSLSAS